MIHIQEDIDIIARTETFSLINANEVIDSDMIIDRLIAMEVDPDEYNRAVRSAFSVFEQQGLIKRTGQTKWSVRNGGTKIDIWEVCN